jgi:hypothetical protein
VGKRSHHAHAARAWPLTEYGKSPPVTEAVPAVEFGGPSPSYGNSFRTEPALLLQPCDRNCCRIGGAIADGVLLNWMLPAQAALARRWA